ncbi:MAG: zinc ribbon domain-containing protein [Methanoculleus sp.]
MILVNPRNTSQMCSRCGMIVAKTLSDRVHSCPHCGLVMDRDQNAGDQHSEIGAAISGITSQDAPGERGESSHPAKPSAVSPTSRATSLPPAVYLLRPGC